MSNYRELNRANRDERVPIHVGSPDDDPALFETGFLECGRSVRPGARLGDLTGVGGIHLQCHVGTDTVSLARLGAPMAGLDLSSPAAVAPRALATRAGWTSGSPRATCRTRSRWPGRVRTTSSTPGSGRCAGCRPYGGGRGSSPTCWRPGGRLFLRGGHPALESIDEARTDALVIGYAYFEQVAPMVFVEDHSYVESDVALTAATTDQWNHGLGEIVTAVLEAGLVLTGLVEHQTVPWEALPGQMEPAGAEFVLGNHRERLALTYTLQAVKPG